jgi:hypothetical protein
MENASPATSFLWSEKIWPHTQHTRHQLGECRTVHVVFHAARKQLAQLAGVNVAQHDDVQALGPSDGQHFFRRAGLFGQVQAGGVHLEHGL